MKKERFFSPLRGSVQFQATGGFPERFLNLCNVRGIALFEPQMQNKILTATVRRGDYFRLRDIAKRSGMTLRALEKRGLPFFLRRHRTRLALPVTAAAMALLAFALSGFVWTVETDGCENVSRREILAVMEELGLRAGVWRKGIDTSTLSQAAMHRLSGRVSWLGVNLSGSRAFVEVHDYLDPGEDESFGDPANLVADFDGLLLSLQVHSGKAVAPVGSGVQKGDLLISGVTTDRYEQAHFYEARGVATALHDDTLTCTLQEKTDFFGYMKVQTIPALRLLHLTIPLGMFPLSREYDVFTSFRQAQWGGVSLPLGLVFQTRCYRAKKRTENAFPVLLDDFSRAFEMRYCVTNVLSSTLRLERNDGKLTLTAQSSCIDFIGQKQPIGKAQAGE